MNYGDLVWDVLDSRYHRVFKVHADGYIELMDRNTLSPLPDYRHPSQVTK